MVVVVDAPDPHSGPGIKDEKMQALVAFGNLVELSNVLTADSLSVKLETT